MNILYRNPSNNITGQLIQETFIFKLIVNLMFGTYYHEVIKIYTLFLFIIVQLLNAFLCNVKCMVLSLIRLACMSQHMCIRITFVKKLLN